MKQDDLHTFTFRDSEEAQSTEESRADDETRPIGVGARVPLATRGLWARQFGPIPTLGQAMYDLVSGILFPLLGLYFVICTSSAIRAAEGTSTITPICSLSSNGIDSDFNFDLTSSTIRRAIRNSATSETSGNTTRNRP